MKQSPVAADRVVAALGAALLPAAAAAFLKVLLVVLLCWPEPRRGQHLDRAVGDGGAAGLGHALLLLVAPVDAGAVLQRGGQGQGL